MEALVQQALQSSTCHGKLMSVMNNKHQFMVFLVHNCGIMCVRVQHKRAHKPTANDSVRAMQTKPVQAVHNAVDQR